MKLFDGHIHIETGLEKYDLVIDAGNVIFNSLEEYHRFRKTVPAGYSVTLILDFKNNFEEVKKIVAEDKSITTLKIHSRIQQLTLVDYPLLHKCLNEMPAHLSVIYDAFYYGMEMEFQPDLPALCILLKNNTKRTFIIAHSGGYKMLHYIFHLRPFENVYYDLSLSLQYLSDSSVYPDMKKLIKFTPKNRILFGSDYPFASPKEQYIILEDIFYDLGLSAEEKENICFNNANALFAIKN